MKTQIISEGNISINVPLSDDTSNFLPSSAAVFYNPQTELNRDITTAVVSAFISYKELDPCSLLYADIMSATGIRGIRIATEVGLKCHMNDWSLAAYQLMQDNLRVNNLQAQCSVSHQNANTLMHQESFDIVDLDPFGSPAPYLDSSARCVRKLLCITATDTAPLCGAHLASGIRKYSAYPLNTEYHKEMGARILLGAAVRALALHDKGVKVLLTHATRHYVRSYLEIIQGASVADKTIEKMGYISHCFNCGFRQWHFGLVPGLEQECPNCHGPLNFAGPLWLGSIQDPGFCQVVLDQLDDRRPGKWKQAVKIVAFCQEEIDIPTYYDQHWLCKKQKISPGPIDELVSVLKKEGFASSRTHFSGTGFKTNASIVEIKKVLHRFL